MKNIIFQFFLILCFFVMLLSPSQVFEGAKSGLLLWFLTVLPTLFPFLIISRMLLDSCACSLLNRLFSPLIGRLFGISAQGSFAVIVGFLCGYPMGAKITADLLLTGQITKTEASYLLSFCNNTSPAFLVSFIVLGYFQDSRLILPSALILYGTPVFLSFFFRAKKHFFFNKLHTKLLANSTEAIASTSSSTSSCSLDACLTDSSEAIVKIGGYIILFSVLLNLLKKIPIAHPLFQLFLLPSLELTNGITLLNNALSAPVGSHSFPLLYSLCMGHTAFGGWCALFQTGSMISGSGLSLKSYALKKLATALATSLFAYLYICWK